MYLKEIYLENTGPISNCHVKSPFDDNGNPLPIVVVGPNGSGKSIFLSYVVDALMEFAKKAFSDIMRPDGLHTPYFRFIQPTGIKSGESFSLSLLHFKANNNDSYYCEKSGVLDSATYSPNVKSVFNSVWKWSKDENHKDVFPKGNIVKDSVKTDMQKGAHAFFPARRHEEPDWLNPKSLKAGMNDLANRRFDDELDKPLWVETCAEENVSWILDVFLDSLIDPDILQRLQILQVEKSRNVIVHNLNQVESKKLRNRQVLRQARQNVERILQAVLQDGTLELVLNYRTSGPSRISIKMSDERIIPNFHALSEGQSQLFHLFTTIIRYGERANINLSIRLHDITGLVVVDEIASHLHPTLQHDVLPQLIRLFPKVQFIVSSHSPLFLLGMEKEFGPDGFDILELPEGKKIDSERFSEFRKAFEYYQDTERFEGEIKQLIANITKPVVMTEGKLDALYIQTALKLLGEGELLDSLEIRPVGNKGKKGDKDGGKNGLNRVLNFHKKDSSLMNQPILLLYDWDTSKPAEQIEKLWVRSIPHNQKNAKVKKGIENLLSPNLFAERFYKTEVKEDGYGGGKIITEFKKKEFCQWICEHGSAADFDRFKEVVKILSEFIEAHQLPPVQQLTSE